MICFIYQPKRKDKRTGRTVASRLYSGRYKLAGDKSSTTVRLNVRDKQAAEEKLRQIVREKERERCGLIPSEAARRAASLPVANHIEEFATDRERIGRSADYVRQLRAKLTLLAAQCGWKVVGDITADSFLAWRAKQTGLSAKTTNEYHNAASSLCNWLRRQRRGLAENPLDALEKSSLVGKETFGRRALSVQEIARLVAVCDVRRVAYMLALYTGLRRREIEKLEWGDLSLDGQTPSVKVRASTAKNRKDAVLPLHPRIAAELRSMRQRLGGVRANQLVLCDGVPSASQLRADLDAAKIPHSGKQRVDFHALRHTYCTLLSLGGASPRVAMEAMRHSDLRLTMKTYTDAGQLPVREAVVSLPDFVQHDAHDCTQIDAPDLGGEGPAVSQAGTDPENVIHAQSPWNQTEEHPLAHSGADCRASEKACAMQGSNLRLLACEASALPLS